MDIDRGGYVDMEDPLQRFIKFSLEDLLGASLSATHKGALLNVLKRLGQDKTFAPQEIALLQEDPGFLIAKTRGELAAVEIEDGEPRLIFKPDKKFGVGVGAGFGVIGGLVKPVMHVSGLQNVGSNALDFKAFNVPFEDMLLEVDVTGALLRLFRLKANGKIAAWYADVNKDLISFGQTELTIPSVEDEAEFIRLLGESGWVTGQSPLAEARFVDGSFVLKGPNQFSVRGEKAVIGLSHLEPNNANRGWTCELLNGARSHVITPDMLLGEEDLSVAVLKNQLLGIGASYSVLAGLQAQRSSVARVAKVGKSKQADGGFWNWKRISRALTF